jgi:cytochrome c oxidase subunit 2
MLQISHPFTVTSCPPVIRTAVPRPYSNEIPSIRQFAHPTIDIVASNWKFTPATITIPVNEPTTLRLTSSSGVHGLQSDELGIPKTTITPGNFQLVTFTPTKAGTYVLHCAVVCGPGHADMTLTIVVTP